MPFEGPGVFVQWLEGPEAAVETTYARIDADARHTDVEIIDRGVSDRRLFPHWSMALETVRSLPDTTKDIVRFAEQRHDQEV